MMIVMMMVRVIIATSTIGQGLTETSSHTQLPKGSCLRIHVRRRWLPSSSGSTETHSLIGIQDGFFTLAIVDAPDQTRVALLKLILIEQLGQGLADLSQDFLDVAHVFLGLLQILLKMQSLVRGELNLEPLHLDMIHLLLNVK